MSSCDWVRAGTRPANQPARRLAGFGAVLPALLVEGPAKVFLAPLAETAGEPDARAHELLGTLRAPLEAPLGEVWTPSGEPRTAPAIGRDRLDDIVVNALLPLVVLWAMRRSDSALARSARAAHAAHPPLGPNALTRAVSAFFAGGDRRRQGIVRNARRQQASSTSRASIAAPCVAGPARSAPTSSSEPSANVFLPATSPGGTLFA